MRYYSVPFSTKEEEKLLFNLSTKEVLVFGSGIIIGVLFAGILALILNTYMLFCLPVALPFVGLAAILALKKIKRSGCELTVGDYLIYKYRFNNRNHHYVRGWKGDK